ncbi:MAG: copZ [Ramlibacter sp.]|nr:copZ [Ramlibacter sp.]
MIAFEVKDMTCGHCVSTITRALKAIDQDAKVNIDLAAHRVEVETTSASVAQLSDAITEAGYTPVETGASPVPVPMPGAAKRSGCCCG